MNTDVTDVGLVFDVDMQCLRSKQFKSFWSVTFPEFQMIYFDQYAEVLQSYNVEPIVLYFALDGFTRILECLPSNVCWRHSLHVFIRFSSIIFGKSDFYYDCYYLLHKLFDTECQCELWVKLEFEILKAINYEIFTWSWPPSEAFSSYHGLKNAIIF